MSQNLVYGHVYQSGIIVACPEGGGRNLIVHNTVVGNGCCIAIWRGDGERVFNNILVSSGDVLSCNHSTKNVAADYNLCRPDSPAIGKGTPEYAQPTDFWGRPLPRGKAPDLGAFAFEPSLATGGARIGWNGWPYRFAPQGEMELSDPWTLPPSEPANASR